MRNACIGGGSEQNGRNQSEWNNSKAKDRANTTNKYSQKIVRKPEEYYKAKFQELECWEREFVFQYIEKDVAVNVNVLVNVL